MAPQVCAADDNLWTKYIFLSPNFYINGKISSLQIAVDVEISDNWRGVFLNQKLTLLRRNFRTRHL